MPPDHPTPTVDYAEPAAVITGLPPLGELLITLHGSGFAPGGDITAWDRTRFNTRGVADSVPEDITEPMDDARLQIRAPSVANACAVDIYLRERTTEQWTALIPRVFTIGDPPRPTVTSVSPSTGPVGATIQVFGANHVNTVGVRLEDPEGRSYFVRSRISAIGYTVIEVPEMEVTEPTSLRVFVTFLAGISYPAGEVEAPAGSFSVMPPSAPPAVYRMAPHDGSVDGGTLVEVSGTNLDLATSVDVEGVVAALTFVSWGSLIFATPPATGEDGNVEVWVRHPLGDVVAGHFTYTPAPVKPPPATAGFTPQTGSTEGATFLNITGTDLDQVTKVEVGSREASSLAANFGLITCFTPPSPAPGAQVVWVTWPGGRVSVPGLFTYFHPAPPPTEEAGCRRKAWLTLDGGREVALEDEAANYFCVNLDIGWPTVREVVNDRPDAHGIDDRTRYFGGRVVSAHIVAGDSRRFTRDDVARLFGPYLLPSVRPVLHWTLDTPENDWAERTLVVRATDYSAPIAGSWRDLHLAWIAPDPIIRSPEDREAFARPASGLASGRRYPLVFDRIYPLGTGSAELGQIVSPGDVLVTPLVRLYGPVTGPAFWITSGLTITFTFRSTFRIDARRFVDVDCAAHTVTADDGTRLEGQVDWDRTRWPFANSGGVVSTLGMSGVSTDWITQAQAIWRDGWLTP